MSFLYVFLAVVIIFSFLIAIVITIVSKKSDGTENLDNNSSDVKEMLESNNLSENTVDVVRDNEVFTSNSEYDNSKNQDYSFVARSNKEVIDENNEEEDEEII